MKSFQVSLYNWENCPGQLRNQINDILEYYHQVLREKLSGFYLHGSLTMGCYVPGNSDIDFLATIKLKMTVKEKKSIINYLLDISQNSSGIKIEMHIVTEESLQQIQNPSPFELHYSDSWRDRFLSGDVDWNSPKYDEDLVMHYLAIRHRGICLYGPSIHVIFPEPPREMWIKSMINDFTFIREHIDSVQMAYAVLNPCRNLAFIREGKLLSKKEGGEWALINLPGEFIPTISQALDNYTNNRENFKLNKVMLYRFLEYVLSEIVDYKI